MDSLEEQTTGRRESARLRMQQERGRRPPVRRPSLNAVVPQGLHRDRTPPWGPAAPETQAAGTTECQLAEGATEPPPARVTVAATEASTPPTHPS